MTGYSAFPKAPVLLEPQHQIVSCHIQDSHWVEVLSLCRDAVSIFYNNKGRLKSSNDGIISAIDDFLD